MSKRANKEKILNALFKRFDKKISKEVVMNVISLFITEFSKELRDKKEIKIGNFCSFILTDTKARRYHDFRQGKILVSKGRGILKLALNRKLRKRIIEHLNIFKTFE